MESSSDHTVLKLGFASIAVNRELDQDPKLELLADPDQLFSSLHCEIVKDQRKIKVARIILEIGGRRRAVYLKRYNAFSWRYRLGSLLLPSGARRSWAAARLLLRSGFLTGDPIAAVECRSWGMLAKSFYLAEEIPGKTVDRYWLEDLARLNGREGFARRRQFLKDLAGLFSSLHGKNIYHNDLKDANILVAAAGAETRFYLLDLEGISLHGYLNQRRQVKNLVQLNRTMGRYLGGAEKLYWLKSYLGASFCDRAVKRAWITKVLRESGRRDRRSKSKS